MAYKSNLIALIPSWKKPTMLKSSTVPHILNIQWTIINGYDIYDYLYIHFIN